MQPLINILIRTSNRKAQFNRCLKSVFKQDYPNIRIIISVDKEIDYVPDGLEVIQVHPNKSLPFYYDEYLNDLIAQIDDGYILILDDDDMLADNCLSKIDFCAAAIVVQLNRAGYIVPQDLNFKRGHIGFPCLLLHHSFKHIRINGNGQGDYFWIKEVEKEVGLNFQPVVVVNSFGRGMGK